MTDLESAIESTEILIEVASKEVLIYDGHFDPKIYESERVVRQIQDAVARGVNIEVICDESIQVTNPILRDLINQGKILIHGLTFAKGRLKGWRRLIGSYPPMHIDSGHYMIVDNLHIRWEEPHEVESTMRRALISYIEERAPEYAKHFRELLKS